MRILTYDEVDADGVTMLDWTCFRWHLTPDLADRLRRLDPWLPDHFALYAVKDDEEGEEETEEAEKAEPAEE